MESIVLSLPPGISERRFSRVLASMAGTVGDEWVFSDESDIALYRDAYSPFRDENEERTASAAIAPATREEVQAVVGIANREGVPLYPISTGKNLAYGGSAPVLSGSVVLDLKRLNRILEVSEANAFALVEPGVSYFDLYRHIQQRGLRLMLDVPSPGWGSVVGNALEHGVGLSPLRDHWGAQCGLEVVLADGSLLRTGMGAMANASTWQQYRYGFGPHLDGLFSQSNLGIVTKMGIWLMPEPEVVRGLRVSLPRHDDIVELVGIAAELSYSNVLDSEFRIRSPILHGFRDADFQRIATSPDGGSAQAWDAYADSVGAPFWEVTFSFYGPETVVNTRWTHVVERYAALSGARFADAPTYRFPMSASERDVVRDKQLLGIPSLEGFGPGTEDATADGHLDFSVVIPMDGAAVLQSLKVLGRTFAESRVGVGIGAIASFHPRTLTFISSFPTFRDDADANRRSREAYLRCAELAATHGWGQYRVHAAFMDQAAASYAFNDHALTRVHERLKNALDPNGILAAGRYGIWPESERDRD